jgi:hypothetical protein
MAIGRPHMDLDQHGQDQKALYMLILSGVVRPSHIGLRYMPLPSQAEEEGTGSQNSPSVPAQALHHLRRVITLLRRWKTQVLSREPQYLQISTFAPRRATTSRMCLRS